MTVFIAKTILTAAQLNALDARVTTAEQTAQDAADALAGKVGFADLAGYARLDSPSLTGTPAAPTAAADTNTVQVATTAFILGQASAVLPAANGTAAIGTSLRFARADHVHGTDATRAALASPTFTGTPAAPTAAVDTTGTQLATVGFVLGQASATTPAVNGTAAVGTSTRFARADHVHATDATRAPLASPTFTGVPAAPTAAVDTNTTQVATTAYVIGQGYIKSGGVSGTYAPLASPTFTGTPAVPTAAIDTNTTQAASTAFVLGQASAVNPLMNGAVAIGTSTRLARADHVHPTDTSRAPTASPTLTGSVTIPTPTAGDNSTLAASTAFVQNAANGLTTVSGLAGIDVTLTAVQAAPATIKLTGTLTANINVILPAGAGRWSVNNATTGAFTITVKYATGTGVVIAQGYTAPLWGDGTNIYRLVTDLTDQLLQGNPTTTTQTGTDNSTRVATTAYVKGQAYATLASPTFTGTPAAPTAAVDTAGTQLATVGYVLAQASATTPVVNGTAAIGTSTRFARADHVHGTDTTRAALASPTFTGVPAAPTAAVDASGTQLATLSYVLGQAAAAVPLVNGTAAVGTATRFARADHVHGTDPTRAAKTTVGITVTDYGAVGSGSVDEAAAFTAAIAALPAAGGVIWVPNGTYRLDSNVTSGTKAIRWEVFPGAKFTGTGRMPVLQSNTAHYASAWTSTTFPSLADAGLDKGYSTISTEVIPDSTFIGNACGAYMGARSSFSGTSFLWGLNTLVELNTGFSGNGISIEADLNNYTATPYKGQGFLVTGVGVSQCEVGVLVQRGDVASRWGKGISVRYSEIGMDIDLSNVGASATNGIMVRGLDQNHIKLQSSADTNPTRAVLYVADAGDTQSVFKITKRGGVAIGPSGTEVQKYFSFTASLDTSPGNMATGTVADVYITNANIAASDTVTAMPSLPLATGVMYSVFPAAGYVQIRIANLSGGVTDPDGTGLTWRVSVWKH